jgi:hypothetical protein
MQQRPYEVRVDGELDPGLPRALSRHTSDVRKMVVETPRVVALSLILGASPPEARPTFGAKTTVLPGIEVGAVGGKGVSTGATRPKTSDVLVPHAQAPLSERMF